MSEINNLTCSSGEMARELLKMASNAIGNVQSKLNETEFLTIAQPIDAVISYLDNNKIKIP